MATQAVSEWTCQVDRGPDWLFVRLKPPPKGISDPFPLAEMVWSLMEQHFARRLVLEMNDLPMLPSQVIGQLVLLHKRIASGGGLMRLCGLSDLNQQVLRLCQLAERFPQYGSREQAVMGYPPGKPR